MTVEKEKDGNTLKVWITGSVDSNTSQELREELTGELSDMMEVRFDMKDMDYISSAGLRVILETYQNLDERDGAVVICNVREEIRDIFILAGYEEFMEMEY